MVPLPTASAEDEMLALACLRLNYRPLQMQYVLGHPDWYLASVSDVHGWKLTIPQQVRNIWHQLPYSSRLAMMVAGVYMFEERPTQAGMGFH